jgi:AcrR family transcriptional regulator
MRRCPCLRDTPAAAGVNAGSLYSFFPGKQDVLLAVLDVYLHGIHPMLLQPACRGIDDSIERVFALLKAYRDHLESTACTYGCPIGSIALEQCFMAVGARLSPGRESTLALGICAHDRGRRSDGHADT